MLGRRSFLTGALATGALPLAVRGADATSASLPRDGKVRFCVFADIHYFPGRYPQATTDGLAKILKRAEAAKCDFVIQLGDMTHRAKDDTAYLAFYRACPLPTYHVLGNHEDDGCKHPETLKALGLETGHYFFDRNGFRFIVADPNYIRWADGSFEHYSYGNYFRRGKREDFKELYASGKKDRIGIVPPDQLAWLRETVATAPFPCVIFSHQSFERRRANACANADEVRKIFDDANATCPGKVLMALNGHHHCDYLRRLNGITYFDVNSASMYYLPKKAHHRLFSEDFRKRVQGADKILAWDDPLSAIVTLTGDGHVEIDGAESVFTEGVTPEKCGFKVDPEGRRVKPFILSASL